MSTNYQPGVCNIGPEEIRMRWMTGWMGFALTVVVWIGLILTDSPASRYYWLFIPAFVSALGLIQASMHFCVAFGAKGLFNFKSQLGKTETVDQASFRAKDRVKAILIIIYALLSAGIVTAIAYYSAGLSN